MIADLAYPIILAADGHLMDGGHRIAKQGLMGKTVIEAVQVEVDPELDSIGLTIHDSRSKTNKTSSTHNRIR